MLAHSWSAMIDSCGHRDEGWSSIRWPRTPRGRRSGFGACCSTAGTTTCYGVIRTKVLRRTALHGSYHFADRTITSRDRLCTGRSTRSRIGCYFRRDHPERAGVLDCARPVREHWTHAGRTGCATRLSACTPNTSGPTSRRFGVRRCRPRIGESVTATWRGGLASRALGAVSVWDPISPAACPRPARRVASWFSMDRSAGRRAGCRRQARHLRRRGRGRPGREAFVTVRGFAGGRGRVVSRRSPGRPVRAPGLGQYRQRRLDGSRAQVPQG